MRNGVKVGQRAGVRPEPKLLSAKGIAQNAGNSVQELKAPPEADQPRAEISRWQRAVMSPELTAES